MTDMTINQDVGRFMRLSGLLLILLGVLAIGAPTLTGSLIVYIIGGVLLFAGITHLFGVSKYPDGAGRIGLIILALIELGFGGAFIAQPFWGLKFLTLVVMFYFLIEGIWKILASFSYRQVAGWSWLLISGILSLVLALLIWNQWPLSGLWAVGILVGVNLMFTGFSFFWLGGMVRKLT